MVTIDFTGKNYIVTGGAGSIGRAIVETVVACGGNVCAIPQKAGNHKGNALTSGSGKGEDF